MVKYEYEVQCVCISKSQTCGQPCTVMGMAAWCWGRDTLMGTAGVRVWTVGAGGSTDTTCCSPSTAGAQPELVINYILSCWFFFKITQMLLGIHYKSGYMRSEFSAIQHYQGWQWFTYTTPCALGHCGAVLGAAGIRLLSSFSHTLISFAFALPISCWRGWRRIDFYF